MKPPGTASSPPAASFWICLFLLATALGSVAAPPARLAPFEKDGKWGYKNRQGAVVISPRFLIADPFSAEGIAAVVDREGWAYIDRTGKLLLRPFIFDNGPDYFKGNLARFVSGGKFGFFNRRGRIVIAPAFDFAAPFSEGRAAVCTGCRKVSRGEHTTREGGKWGFIDRAGRLVIPTRFDEVRAFENGEARIRLGQHWRYITKDGAFVFPGRSR